MEKKSTASRAFYRTILMYGFHLLVVILCTNKVRDTQCGFKLFTCDTAKKLFANLHIERWAFDIEIIYLAEALGIPMKEVMTMNQFSSSK
jgi:dolichyl-phosphate beta-glucosyltransferase